MMDKAVFDAYRKLVYEQSGIAIKNGKESLVSARVQKRMRALNIAGQREYLKYVQNDKTGNEMIHLLDVISTNTTHFFREADHFDFIQMAMKRWIEKGQTRFRHWCCASSSGEEPYTLAMILSQLAEGHNLDQRILATDISTTILERAQAGIYEEQKIGDIPKLLRQKYFDKRNTARGEAYQVKKSLRDMVLFKRLNLSKPPFPMKGPLDIVLCRNVMIYFDDDVRTALINDVHRLLKPEGFLIVGKSEGLVRLDIPFKMVSPSIYMKK